MKATHHVCDVLYGDTSLAKFLVHVEFGASSGFFNMCLLLLASKDSPSFFFFGCGACGIFVPRPGIEPRPMAVKASSPNHWTAREFQRIPYPFSTSPQYLLQPVPNLPSICARDMAVVQHSLLVLAMKMTILTGPWLLSMFQGRREIFSWVVWMLLEKE